MTEALPTKRGWTAIHTGSLLVILVAIVVAGSLTTGVAAGTTAPWTWYLIMALLVLFILVAGHGVTGRFWSGFMIDSRNKMTLSRLQLIVWTVVVLSAYLTVVLARINTLGTAALSVAIPAELWWLMGISTASLVGSPLILSNKEQQKRGAVPREQSLRLQAAQEGVKREEIEFRQGTLGAVVYNAAPGYARFADLFRGDETGNSTHLDLGKVQMFFFTVVLVVAYVFALAEKFPELLAAGASFPPLDDGMVALLGISHAGYLAHKAVPHTPPAGVEHTAPASLADPEPGGGG